jgi:hypothetical protein
MSAFLGIVLQKSKIEQPQKSRESRFLDVPTAAKPYRADTKVRGRFCVKRCGPSYRRVRNASAALKNFGRHPKKTFATLSWANRTKLVRPWPAAFGPIADSVRSAERHLRDAESSTSPRGSACIRSAASSAASASMIAVRACSKACCPTWVRASLRVLRSSNRTLSRSSNSATVDP